MFAGYLTRMDQRQWFSEAEMQGDSFWHSSEECLTSVIHLPPPRLFGHLELVCLFYFWFIFLIIMFKK